jgi:alkylated DNA repair dioxygenase AlkB
MSFFLDPKFPACLISNSKTILAPREVDLDARGVRQSLRLNVEGLRIQSSGAIDAAIEHPLPASRLATRPHRHHIGVSTMITAQSDLFDRSPVLPGLSLAEEFITPAEEQALIAKIDAADLSPFRFQGWTGKRLTTSFGWRYDFDNGRFGPADPIPDWLLPVRDEAAAFAGLASDDLVQALLIRYDPGAGIGWHRDRPVFEHVVGISLGSPTPLRFRQRVGGGFKRMTVLLLPRSIYHLAGEVRHQWEHSIVEGTERRWSITFRSLAGPKS